jgi:hypothetical protein
LSFIESPSLFLENSTPFVDCFWGGLPLFRVLFKKNSMQKKLSRKYYIPHFTHAELACKQTGKIVLAAGFAEKLVELRTLFAQSMPVVSSCRSREYNTKIGGAKNSFHIYDFPHHSGKGCCAVDIKTSDSTYRGELITLAWNLGWSIGIHKNFLHLDRRIDYTNSKQIVFLYY